MRIREAEKFEEALQRANRGEKVEEQQAPLVRAAQQASALSAPPPPPPYRLSPGRQRFLAEAANLRAAKMQGKKGRLVIIRPLKLATALVAVLILFGLVFGAGQAAAASLPGELLYPLKLAGEGVLLELTTDADAWAALNLALAERRLDEITELLEAGEVPDEAAVQRAGQQLRAAEAVILGGAEETPEWAFLKLYAMLQVRRRTMQHLLPELTASDQEVVETLQRELERSMERTRQELHQGQGTPDGEQERMRYGTPPDASELPDPSEMPGIGPQPEDPPAGPPSEEQPGPGPQPEDPPAGTPPEEVPGAGPGPQPEDPPGQQNPEPPQPGPDTEPGSPMGPGNGEAPGNTGGSGGGISGAGNGH